ncbi:hypothetical protein SAMN05421780_101256 [Flexibacter flexilis DSM 6793]|uniref:Uncharacterized protein n=1 Tax=Flexibacter flexilis DSM 6793 TaxID=927664 RepID=A0A1I1DQD2_9BACT|nr:hypothetical protein [Flexibacter flexilis]SFB74910.1 hypothetical protein SAMN05421780_101256 [Flexibacter flexilis DSM 6793]
MLSRTSILLIPFSFMLLGIVLLADKMLGLATAEPTQVRSIHKYRQNSLYYKDISLENGELYKIQSHVFDKEIGDKVYTYKTMDLASLAFFILPSSQEHPFIVKNMWYGFHSGVFFSLAYNFMCLIPLFILIWIKVKFRAKK